MEFENNAERYLAEDRVLEFRQLYNNTLDERTVEDVRLNSPNIAMCWIAEPRDRRQSSEPKAR